MRTPYLLRFHVGLIAVLAFVIALAPFNVYADVVPKYTGFTRPGAPGDSRSDGKIRFIADIEKYRDEAIGATVYYMVLKKNGNAEDPWGIGIPDAVGAFKSGIDADGSFSPDLDTDAEYLYLYQVVNDRRTFQPIQSASIEIIVDLKNITSWGHFRGIGFGTIQAAQEEKVQKIRSVSFNYTPAEGISKMYMSPAPPITESLQPTMVPTERGQAKPKKETSPLVQVSWDALDPARDPNLVMLFAESETKKTTGSLRAIWNGEAGLEKDNRSTVFGFTSPLKPKFVAVRIQSDVDEKQKNGKKSKIRLTGDGVSAAGLESAGIQAEGRVPSPYSLIPVAEEPVAPGLPPPPVLPNPPLTPAVPSVVPGGAPSVAPAGGISGVGDTGGFAATGFGGGTGGGSAQGEVVQRQDERQDGLQTINFNATLINQQAQFQAQAQAQKQSQRQRQKNKGGNGENGDPAISEPYAWLLSAIALPVLFWMQRRRPKTAIV